MNTVRLAEPHIRGAHTQCLQIFNDVVDATLLRSFYAVARTLTIPPNFFWISSDRVVRHRDGDKGQVDELRKYLPDTFASFLFDYTARLLGGELIPWVERDQIAGFEVWVNNIGSISRVRELLHRETATPEKGFLHIDSDESKKGISGVVQSPMWGTILHVGPEQPIAGGQTTFLLEPDIGKVLAHCYAQYSQPELGTISADWVNVSQRASRLIVFEGNRPHILLPVRAVPSDDQPRTTLLVNLWRSPPTRFSNTSSDFFPISATELRFLHRVPAQLLSELRIIASVVDVRTLMELVLGAESSTGQDALYAMNSSQREVVDRLLRILSPKERPPFVKTMMQLDSQY